jgi:hypothetical protein
MRKHSFSVTVKLANFLYIVRSGYPIQRDHRITKIHFLICARSTFRSFILFNTFIISNLIKKGYYWHKRLYSINGKNHYLQNT